MFIIDYKNKGCLYTWCSIQTRDIFLYFLAAAVESNVDIHSKTVFWELIFCCLNALSSL